MSFVKVEQKEGYAILTIDREKALNASTARCWATWRPLWTRWIWTPCAP